MNEFCYCNKYFGCPNWLNYRVCCFLCQTCYYYDEKNYERKLQKITYNVSKLFEFDR